MGQNDGVFPLCFCVVRHCRAEPIRSESIFSNNSIAKFHPQHRATSSVRVITMALRQICFALLRVDVHKISVLFLHYVLHKHGLQLDVRPKPPCLHCLTVDMVQQSDTVAEFTHEVLGHHPFR